MAVLLSAFALSVPALEARAGTLLVAGPTDVVELHGCGSIAFSAVTGLEAAALEPGRIACSSGGADWSP